MHSLKPAEKRRESIRRHVYQMAKMQMGPDNRRRECMVVDIFDTGAKLYVVGFDVPDEFVLFLSGDSIGQRCKVISRRGPGDVGVKFISQELPRAT
jgi:hypothetical protein